MECVFVSVCVRGSQCAEVMAGPGLLPEDLAAPVAAHFPVAATLPVAPVRARHQPGQKALGATRQALSASRRQVAVHPPGAHAVPSRAPHRRLQQLVRAVFQRGGELQVDAVEHRGAGLGLWRGKKTKERRTDLVLETCCSLRQSFSQQQQLQMPIRDSSWKSNKC